MSTIKKMDNEALEKVGGGTALTALREEVNGMIPAEVQEKLNAANGKAEAYRILTENGIDVERIKKKMADAGLDEVKIGLQELPDEALDKIAGGFESDGVEIRCPCGTYNSSCFSYQIIDTWMSTDIVAAVYRCKNCGMYITKLVDGRVQYYKD